MKKYVIEDESGGLHVVGANGFIPDGFVCEAPADAGFDDGDVIDIVNRQAIINTERKAAKIAAVLAAEEADKVNQLRRAEYPTTDELIIALWEKVIENRPEAAQGLQARREAVKAKYPKAAK